MSILIKGLGMPNAHQVRPFYLKGNGDGTATVYEYTTGMQTGVAVPLPEGHGRMGDLDEMMEYIKNHEYELKSRMGCVGKGMFTYQIQEYTNNHTILPAEGGGDA